MRTRTKSNDIVKKLKQKIAEAQAKNDVVALSLQQLLDAILRNQKQTPAA